MESLNTAQFFDAAIRHHEAGRLAQAEAIYRQILNQDPRNALVLTNLGDLLYKKGDFDGAIVICQRAIAVQASSALAYGTLGASLLIRGQLDKGIAACRRAIELKPDYAEVYCTLGGALQKTGELDAAIAACERAIQLRPNYFYAYLNLGIALKLKNEPKRAIATCQKAIQLRPDDAIAYNHLGAALESGAQIDQAIMAYEKAIQLWPAFSIAHDNLGAALARRGQKDEALAHFERAVALNPHYSAAESNRIFCLQFHPDFSAARRLEETKKWSQRYEQPLLGQIRPHPNDRSVDRRLRIGYLSGCFWKQAEAYFMIPLLENHDHEQFEVFCYSASFCHDAITDRHRQFADTWRNITSLRDDRAAELIRQDRIDILIDLGMHMGGSRPMIFAHKPAPIQVAYLAYPGSTGMRAMDYLFTDSYMDPPGAPWSLYTEEPVRLPDCWCCFDPLTQIPSARPRGQGPIRFGSLNNPCKHNEGLLRLWASILCRVQDSRLLLLSNSAVRQKQIITILESEGIGAGRIEFTGHLPRQAYLRLYDQIDICLDPLPYNGITTTCDALWMGVPVISLAGDTSTGRAGGSIVRTIGLPELATETPEQFVSTCVQLANDRARLAELRATLRQKFEQSPMMDGKRFARNVETAYRQMWHFWVSRLTGDLEMAGDQPRTDPYS